MTPPECPSCAEARDACLRACMRLAEVEEELAEARAQLEQAQEALDGLSREARAQLYVWRKHAEDGAEWGAIRTLETALSRLSAPPAAPKPEEKSDE